MHMQARDATQKISFLFAATVKANSLHKNEINDANFQK